MIIGLQLHAEFRQASVIFDLSVYLLNRAILEFKHIDKQSYQIITITCLSVYILISKKTHSS